MKIKNKILAVPACLALMTTSAHSALVLEFNEVDGNVELTFSGSVDIGGSYERDGLDGVSLVSSLLSFGLSSAESVSGSSAFSSYEFFGGESLLTSSLVTVDLIGDSQIGLVISGDFLLVGILLDPAVSDNTYGDVMTLSANSGGVLFNKKQTFAGNYTDSGLNLHAADALIDLWRVKDTTGTDNLIQFRVNSVPEPSSAALLGLGAIGLVARRKRQA